MGGILAVVTAASSPTDARWVPSRGWREKTIEKQKRMAYLLVETVKGEPPVATIAADGCHGALIIVGKKISTDGKVRRG